MRRVAETVWRDASVGARTVRVGRGAGAGQTEVDLMRESEQTRQLALGLAGCRTLCGLPTGRCALTCANGV